MASTNHHSPLRERLRHVPWARVAYPFGVVCVFLAIGALFLFSRNFFAVSINRMTTIPFARNENTDTFHLAAYKQIMPLFSSEPSQKALATPFVRSALTVVLKNAQTQNDRVGLLEQLLKDDGWKATTIASTEKVSPLATVIAAKKQQADAALFLKRLFEKHGFIVSIAPTPLAEEKTDILITLGAY